MDGSAQIRNRMTVMYIQRLFAREGEVFQFEGIIFLTPGRSEDIRERFSCRGVFCIRVEWMHAGDCKDVLERKGSGRHSFNDCESLLFKQREYPVDVAM